jgi:hypothetical protein
MKQFEEYNEDELRQMEEQLRSFPEPYSSNAPDERYFANFRVRVFDRIEAAQPVAKQSVLANIFAWFTPMRSLATGLAVVIVALGSAWLFSSSPTPQVAAVMTQPAPAPHTVEAPATKPTPQAPATTLVPVQQAPKQIAEVSEPTHHTHLAKAVPPNTVSAKDAADEVFAAAGISDASSDATNFDADDSPVDYASLSSDELQAVLNDISH